MSELDVVIPVFNEAEGLTEFHSVLQAALSKVKRYSVRFVYVNDGSTDGTEQVLRRLSLVDPRISVINLSRNFGHQAALTAGLDHAKAQVVIMLDGDGQHPPELIPEMLRLYELGFDIVQTQRLDPESSRLAFKSLSAKAFYWLINRLGELDVRAGAADFRLLSIKALTAIRSMPEYHRFIRGMVAWIGFRTAVLPYEPSRRLAGVSKYSLRQMLKLAANGIFSFSVLPLRIGILLGTCFLILASLEIGYVAMFWITGRSHMLVPGWSSLIILLTISGGITMVALGFIGIYIGMIFQEVKGRPAYIIESGLEGTKASSSGVDRP